MRIPTARYITDDDIKIITLKEMTKKKYDAIYKGKLYCPTDHCIAKVSFSSGPKAHYKTWRYSNHSSDCMYQLDRVETRTLIKLGKAVTVNISNRRKQDALVRAYKSMILSENEIPIAVQENKNEIRKKSPKKDGQLTEQTVQMRLFGGEVDEGDTHFKGKKLLSKFVDAIIPTDIGEVRLIKGFVKDIELIDSVAEIIVGYQDEEIKIVFEERFKKEPLNKSYLEKFWAIKDLLSIKKVIVFNGVGEIREDKSGSYELSIILGSDIRLNGEDLYNIARSMMLTTTQ
ncbi:hypothetical protein [Ureibacillus manganicus]|uniref:Uncharacterized protein n=1 Tax=Ureibacillus manganicus DSM 26584 TaxID=1384049 RepID=A0A0A3I0F8_9BACL|nr:hypothetical protein [Ureibacillus manganicus]KGR78291.1 hypothetical protein CD29_11245 [Ureibacillus manganicus DSM 26584]